MLLTTIEFKVFPLPPPLPRACTHTYNGSSARAGTLLLMRPPAPQPGHLYQWCGRLGGGERPMGVLGQPDTHSGPSLLLPCVFLAPFWLYLPLLHICLPFAMAEPANFGTRLGGTDLHRLLLIGSCGHRWPESCNRPVLSVMVALLLWWRPNW